MFELRQNPINRALQFFAAFGAEFSAGFHLRAALGALFLRQIDSAFGTKFGARPHFRAAAGTGNFNLNLFAAFGTEFGFGRHRGIAFGAVRAALLLSGLSRRLLLRRTERVAENLADASSRA